MAEYSVKYLDGEEEESVWISRAGKAEVTFPNGQTYVGDFNENKERHGQGVYTWIVVAPEDAEEPEEGWPPPAVYTGSYSLGKRSGVGKMAHPDGGTYYGQWKNNAMDGEGTYKYPNGDIYSGSWSAGLKHGPGKYLFKNNSLFDGIWERGGIVSGMWSYPDGTKFTGPFVDGFPCGKGNYVFQSGNKQSGEYIRVSDNTDKEDEFATVPRWVHDGICAAK
jgi:hypothetical protein